MARTKFDSDVAELNQRFTNPLNSKYLFRSVNEDNNVPLDGLQFYMGRVWKKIKECKDLDLPNQKILMSVFRCTQIKVEIFEKIINPSLETISKKLSENIYPSLAEDSSKVYLQAQEEFDEQTKYYDANEVAKHRKEIVEVLKENLTAFLKKQLMMIGKYAKKEINNSMQKIKFEQQYFQGFDHYAKSYQELLKGEIFEMIDRSVAPEFQYDTAQFKEQILKELEESFENLKKTHMEKYTEYFLEKNLTGPIQEKIKNLFAKLTLDFWLHFNGFYLDFYLQKEAIYQNTLVKSYGQSPERAKELALELRNKTEKVIEDQIKLKLNELNYFLKETYQYIGFLVLIAKLLNYIGSIINSLEQKMESHATGLIILRKR